jgi:hypothetical protein
MTWVRGEAILYLDDRPIVWLATETKMTYEDMPAFQGTECDPITKRMISNRCWNGRHQEEGEPRAGECVAEGCQCMCHDGRGWF